MPTGNEQGDERKGRRLLFQHRRQQVAFHMMHAHGRNAPGERQGLGAGGADQQRTNQPGAGGVGDGLDLLAAGAGLIQHLADQRQHAFDVVARSELRHNATIDAMQIDLTEQRVGQQAALAVVERDAGLVAGGFQAQH